MVASKKSGNSKSPSLPTTDIINNEEEDVVMNDDTTTTTTTTTPIKPSLKRHSRSSSGGGGSTSSPSPTTTTTSTTPVVPLSTPSSVKKRKFAASKKGSTTPTPSSSTSNNNTQPVSSTTSSLSNIVQKREELSQKNEELDKLIENRQALIYQLMFLKGDKNSNLMDFNNTLIDNDLAIHLPQFCKKNNIELIQSLVKRQQQQQQSTPSSTLTIDKSPIPSDQSIYSGDSGMSPSIITPPLIPLPNNNNNNNNNSTTVSNISLASKSPISPKLLNESPFAQPLIPSPRGNTPSNPLNQQSTNINQSTNVEESKSQQESTSTTTTSSTTTSSTSPSIEPVKSPQTVIKKLRRGSSTAASSSSASSSLSPTITPSATTTTTTTTPDTSVKENIDKAINLEDTEMANKDSTTSTTSISIPSTTNTGTIKLKLQSPRIAILNSNNNVNNKQSSEMTPMDLEGEQQQQQQIIPPVSPKPSSLIPSIFAPIPPINQDARDKANEDALTMRKIQELQKQGIWRNKQLHKLPEPPRPKVHWDYLLEEMAVVAEDFARLRSLKNRATKSLVRDVKKYHQRLVTQEERLIKEEEERKQKVCATLAKDVKKFWFQIGKLAEYKNQIEIDHIKKQEREKQLNSIVERTEKYSSMLAQGLRERESTKDKKQTFASLLENANLIQPQEGGDEYVESDSDSDYKSDQEGSDADDGEDEDIMDDDDDHDADFKAEEQDMMEQLRRESEMSIEDLLKQELEGVDANYEQEEKEMKETAKKLQLAAQMRGGVTTKTKVPFLIKGTLREYQHIGLDWLASLYNKNLNGVLADEMGLGKTIQTISLLAYLAVEKGIWGPHLIVVPSSVLFNWEMEFKKWCPGFKVFTYHGSIKERKLKRKGWSKDNAFHVCITSYSTILSDQPIFRIKKWVYLILDEAHSIKNFKSKRWQSMLNFNSERRLLLTGTPLQNNLMELWSLMHFLMPDIFQSHKEFQEWFSLPVTGMIENSDTVNDELIGRLHSVLRPFLLRRLKKDVEKQMPRKYTHLVPCQMSRRQKYLYEEFINANSTQTTLQSGTFFSIINILMQLRKVCNHPDLFEVRPIVSPFDCHPVIYEVHGMVTDILSDSPQETINLDLLNLNLWEYEHSLRAMDAKTITELVPSDHRIRDNPNTVSIKLNIPHLNQSSSTNPTSSTTSNPSITSIGNPNTSSSTGNIPIPMPISASSSTINNSTSSGTQPNVAGGLGLSSSNIVTSLVPTSCFDVYQQHRQEHDKQRQRDILDRAIMLKRRNYHRPIYGWDLVKAVKLEDPVSDIHIIASDPSRFLEYSDTIKSLILTPQQRSESMKSIFETFVFLIPKTRSSEIQLVETRPNPSKLLRRQMYETSLIRSIQFYNNYRNPQLSHSSHNRLLLECQNDRLVTHYNKDRQIPDAFEPLQEPFKRMKLYFPDKRLVQYDCGKLQRLASLLRELKQNGHRALIFTQMTKMLDVFESFLNLHGYTYLRLDGATKVERRQYLCERFNKDNRIFLFILSTRSGGLGLNLTGADTVIFYDTDWNPSMDAQAQDRCHRIGQTREVHIYRLITQHTIEENILKKSNQKRQLDDMVIQGGEFTTDFFKNIDLSQFITGDNNDGEGAGKGRDILATMSNSSSSKSPKLTSATTQKEWESAVEKVEDESDVLALKNAQREQAMEYQEFEEFDRTTPPNTTTTPPLGEEDNEIKQQQDLVEEYLTSIQRFALRFYENMDQYVTEPTPLSTTPQVVEMTDDNQDNEGEEKEEDESSSSEEEEEEEESEESSSEESEKEESDDEDDNNNNNTKYSNGKNGRNNSIRNQKNGNQEQSSKSNPSTKPSLPPTRRNSGANGKMASSNPLGVQKIEPKKLLGLTKQSRRSINSKQQQSPQLKIDEEADKEILFFELSGISNEEFQSSLILYGELFQSLPDPEEREQWYLAPMQEPLPENLFEQVLKDQDEYYHQHYHYLYPPSPPTISFESFARPLRSKLKRGKIIKQTAQQYIYSKQFTKEKEKEKRLLIKKKKEKDKREKARLEEERKAKEKTELKKLKNETQAKKIDEKKKKLMEKRGGGSHHHGHLKPDDVIMTNTDEFDELAENVELMLGGKGDEDGHDGSSSSSHSTATPSTKKQSNRIPKSGGGLFGNRSQSRKSIKDGDDRNSSMALDVDPGPAWLPQEDVIILDAVRSYGMNWDLVCYLLLNSITEQVLRHRRTKSQCAERYKQLSPKDSHHDKKTAASASAASATSLSSSSSSIITSPTNPLSMSTSGLSTSTAEGTNTVITSPLATGTGTTSNTSTSVLETPFPYSLLDHIKRSVAQNKFICKPTVSQIENKIGILPSHISIINSIPMPVTCRTPSEAASHSTARIIKERLASKQAAMAQQQQQQGQMMARLPQQPQQQQALPHNVGQPIVQIPQQQQQIPQMGMGIGIPPQQQQSMGGQIPIMMPQQPQGIMGGVGVKVMQPTMTGMNPQQQQPPQQQVQYSMQPQQQQQVTGIPIQGIPQMPQFNIQQQPMPMGGPIGAQTIPIGVGVIQPMQQQSIPQQYGAINMIPPNTNNILPNTNNNVMYQQQHQSIPVQTQPPSTTTTTTTTNTQLITPNTQSIPVNVTPPQPTPSKPSKPTSKRAKKEAGTTPKGKKVKKET